MPIGKLTTNEKVRAIRILESGDNQIEIVLMLHKVVILDFYQPDSTSGREVVNQGKNYRKWTQTIKFSNSYRE